MMMNHSTVATPMPVGVPFAPYDGGHAMALRYMDRQLIDDVAGESVVDGVEEDTVVFMSDLPSHARVLRPGVQWPHGILLPSDTVFVVVDRDSIIKFVGCLEERRGSMA
ncbi:hypothetical protein H4S06_004162 [Coemansia sp. BCRC 34490]|nr:hypothetical protein LPJ72_000321 [Coemansia sp. Benny D160-2]KAJ2511969.1 hypothetical protein H4217_007124 [Coemansia sp. RSA 1939]KAJ2515103.1 hypothetical protein GGI11_003860 [Coemansia sp. RSA 2049]KAJ2607243.1 hypothetical protein EV177_005625 [Coemansia sp. RSA 1804]KAJ2751355.1 hypothetical protein H4S06_004162 [Coemansia sp. BCRC 34490]